MLVTHFLKRERIFFLQISHRLEHASSMHDILYGAVKVDGKKKKRIALRRDRYTELRVPS